MKIALYKSIECDYVIIKDVTDEFSFNYIEKNPDYVRVSDYMEVDFVMLEKTDYAAKVMAAFDEKEKAVRLQLANSLAAIDRARQEFMAITHEVAA
jgi:hypothetical protein